MERSNDIVRLCGTLAERPVWSHDGKDGAYYKFPLEVVRLSGTADTLNILVSEKMMERTELGEGSKILITGELRSFNNRSGVGPKLVLTVLARSVEFTEGKPENSVFLSGTICKEPNFRETPMGREICDIMLAVNRRYGRSDYIPCIIWGAQAELAAQWQVGDRVDIWGRMQSREYIKNDEAGAIQKTAYEVSAAEVVKRTETE